MNTRKITLFNISVVTVVLFVVLFLPLVSPISPTRSNRSSANDLVLSVYVGDDLVVQKDNDMWLENWINMTVSFFDPDTLFTVKDADGDTWSIYGAGRLATDSGLEWYYGISWLSGHIRIAIGTGTTAPDKDDFKLETYWDDNSISQPTLTYSGSQMNISFSSSFTLTSAKSISEAGLMFNQFCKSTGYEYSDLYVARDTFTPIAVPQGGTITIVYTIRFNVT